MDCTEWIHGTIPLEAIRETLLNALVHRDYSFSGSTLINIFDDRIEVISLVGLVKGITYDDIMLGASILRNKKLANIFYRLKLIEAYGAGMPKIINSYKELGVKPQIEISDNAFKIILPNTNAVSKLSAEIQLTDKEQAALLLFTEKNAVTRKEVEEVLSVSQPLAVRILNKLSKKGLIKRLGNGKNTRYEAKN